MDPRKKEIDHLEGEVRRLEAQITAECVDIGRRLAAVDRGLLRHEELRKYLVSIDTLRRSVEGFRTDIDRIRQLSRSIDTLARELEENGRRRDQILRERQGRLTELGAGSFEVYRALTDPQPWRSLFEDVLKIDDEAARRQEELKTLESQDREAGFFDKIRIKTRKVLLRGDLTRLDREKTTAFGRAGARLADSDFGALTQGPLRQLYDTLLERRAAADALSLENDRKVEEIEAARAELKRLEADGDPETRVREVQRRVDGLLKELDVMHCWAGQIYIERDLREEAADAALAAKFEIVAGLRESIARKRQQVDRLRAEIESEEIQRAERDRRARRKLLDEERRIKERQIATLDIEINAGLRRLEELRRVLAGEAPYREAPPLPPSPDLDAPPPESPKS